MDRYRKRRALNVAAVVGVDAGKYTHTLVSPQGRSRQPLRLVPFKVVCMK